MIHGRKLTLFFFNIKQCVCDYLVIFPLKELIIKSLQLNLFFYFCEKSPRNSRETMVKNMRDTRSGTK